MVDTLQDISVDETKAQSVKQHLNDTITDGIPVSPVSNAGLHRHITHAVPEHTVNDSVMENPGPDLASHQGDTDFTQELSNNCVDTGLPGPSADIYQGQNITQQEINERKEENN